MLFAGPEGQLEGSLAIPDSSGSVPAIVVCHPHPQYGGSMDNNVVSAIVAGAYKRGIASLCFNFRGVGLSDGAYGGGDGEREDVKAALAFLSAHERIDPLRLGLTGYSFGAGVCLRTVDELPEVRALALVSLPVRNAAGLLATFSHPAFFIVGDQDHIVQADALRAFAAGLPQPAQVEVVRNADHFWMGFENDIADKVGGFLAEHLGGKAT